jgi:hypothetical protein
MRPHPHVGSQRGFVVAPSLLLIDDMPMIGLAKVNRIDLLIDPLASQSRTTTKDKMIARGTRV